MDRQSGKNARARPVAPEIVALPAEIDIANAHDVRCQLIAAVLRPGAEFVIADMTATTFSDSMGLRALILATKQAAEAGTELRIVAPDPHILRVIKMTGTEHYLRLYPNMAAALAGDCETSEGAQSLRTQLPASLCGGV